MWLALWHAIVVGTLSLEETGWVVAITGGASTLLTLLCTKGVDALLKLRKARTDEIMEEKKYEDSQEAVAFQQATAAYDKLRQALEARVATLETSLTAVNDELKTSRKEHVGCLLEQERLRGELKALRVHVERLWTHDQANKDQVAALAEGLKQVEAAKQAEAGK